MRRWKGGLFLAGFVYSAVGQALGSGGWFDMGTAAIIGAIWLAIGWGAWAIWQAIWQKWREWRRQTDGSRRAR